MPSLFIVSEDKSIVEDISTILPEGWSKPYYLNFKKYQDLIHKNPIEDQSIYLFDFRGGYYPEEPIVKPLGLTSDWFAIIDDISKRGFAFAAGMTDYLLWPILPSELNARLSQVLIKTSPTLSTHSSMDLSKRISGERSSQHLDLPNARLMIVGYLTSHICHEINNSLQAMQGALSLAQEEKENSETLSTYVRICQQEVMRIVKLVQRMRQLYQPDESRQPVDLKSILQNALSTTSELMSQQNMTVFSEIDPDIPPIEGNKAHLDFLFLTILVIFIEVTRIAGGEDLVVQTKTHDAAVIIDILKTGFSESHGPSHDILLAISNEIKQLLSISEIKEIMMDHNGTIDIIQKPGGINIQVILPSNQIRK